MKNELRIGNWVYHEPTIDDWEIIQANPGTMIQCEINPEGFDPIRLTEEWLLKFGFEMINKGFFELKVGNLNFEYTKDLNNNWYMLINEDIKVYLDYVHQFQNLYFSLTNKEIMITEHSK
jgi:hypothetical protein